MTAEAEERDGGDVRRQVRQAYGAYAEKFVPRQSPGCCGEGSEEDRAKGTGSDVIQMYETSDVTELPEEVTGMALGCGDPVTLAALRPGQTVLDLGSGGGIDCFLAAKRVGPSGLVIGVDMTAGMIEKARHNKERLGTDNVEFRLGEIEHLPVADGSVDVVISNCVINLSPDKPQVFREAFRVLRPGGRLAVSDMMTDGPLPKAIRESIGAWAGCVGGALSEEAYLAAIESAGFVEVTVERIYPDPALLDAELEALGLAGEAKDGRHAVVKMGDEVRLVTLDEGEAGAKVRTFSGKVTARKPAVE